jgi:hypothetical protein
MTLSSVVSRKLEADRKVANYVAPSSEIQFMLPRPQIAETERGRYKGSPTVSLVKVRNRKNHLVPCAAMSD